MTLGKVLTLQASWRKNGFVLVGSRRDLKKAQVTGPREFGRVIWGLPASRGTKQAVVIWALR